MIASLNLTRKCLERTCDFILVTHDPEVARGLIHLFEIDSRSPDSPLPVGLTEALIVGPEQARTRFMEMIASARRSIRIVDHRVTDPEVLALLRMKASKGTFVQVLGHGGVADMVSHGKMILVDDAVAAIGSISLSRPSLNLRREAAAVVQDSGNVLRLRQFFEAHSAVGDGLAQKWILPNLPVEEDDSPDDSD